MALQDHYLVPISCHVRDYNTAAIVAATVGAIVAATIACGVYTQQLSRRLSQQSAQSSPRQSPRVYTTGDRRGDEHLFNRATNWRLLQRRSPVV